MNFHIYVRVWAGEWCGESFFDQFSFLSEKIDRERHVLMTKWNLKIGHVISRCGKNMYLYMHADCEERSRDQCEIPFRHQGAPFLVDM